MPTERKRHADGSQHQRTGFPQQQQSLDFLGVLRHGGVPGDADMESVKSASSLLLKWFSGATAAVAEPVETLADKVRGRRLLCVSTRGNERNCAIQLLVNWTEQIGLHPKLKTHYVAPGLSQGLSFCPRYTGNHPEFAFNHLGCVLPTPPARQEYY